MIDLDFTNIHGTRYTYKGIVGKKLEIVCPDHGVFWKLIHHHRNGQGCPACVGKKRIGQEEFVEQARIKHGQRYGYERAIYKGKKTKILITCSIHGDFEQTPKKHLSGQGCARCGGTFKNDRASFLSKARTVHGDRYNYDGVVYETNRTKVRIVCTAHGEFEQAPSKHLTGQGCPRCGGSVRHSNESFVSSSREVHGDLYQYDGLNYQNAKTKVVIECAQHGPFEQMADNHVRGSGCPTCKVSHSQREISEFVKSLGIDVKVDDRQMLDGLEIDVWMPAKNVGLEYHSFAFHVIPPLFGRIIESGYHREKYRRATKKGITLIQIAEDEWRDRRETCEKVIRHQLGLTERGKAARHLQVRKIDLATGREFLEQHHLQGGCSGVHYGAFEAEVLVGVMVFSKPTRQSSHDWELRRFASDFKTRPGLFSKLFAAFRRDHDPKSVVTFADLRWFSGKSYQSAGFIYEATIAPDYWYVNLKERILVRRHKSKFRKQNFPGEGTERERTLKAGYSRFYDAGKARWVWSA